ncbi:MAG: sorbosone dehydrogenase family protein [Betaproteobacteria bacterium]|nr:MAG: sorbosone dehydrogenase family protein [Betaproteobacteria bacterium]
MQTGFACLAIALPQAAPAQRLPLERIKLPPGFEIGVFADEVPDARSLALGKGKVLFVGTRTNGSVYAVRYRDAKATQVITLASSLRMPNGVAVRGGALYVAEVGRILRFDDVEAHLDARPKPVVVTDRFPRETHHGWKFIRFGPDGWLYVPVGAPCNICEPDAARYALISRIRPDGSGYEVFASGVRNSVGFDWDPRTKELWFTDNGADNMGNDVPPDELDHAPRAGMNFGFPYCHGGDMPDPRYGDHHPCSEFAPPARKLGAHVAALGMRFYTGTKFPEQYRGAIFIAEHGSWNRNPKSGYRLSVVRVEGARAVTYEPFATGWLQGDDAWGRPVDVIVAPDGALLVSDERAGVVYRIDYAGR